MKLKKKIINFCLQAIQPYLNDTEFDPDFVRTKSGAAAGLCAWVRVENYVISIEKRQ